MAENCSAVTREVSVEGSVFITGCSTGIGRETARYFRDRGIPVAATARRPEVLVDEESEHLVAIACDVDSMKSVEAAVAEAEERLGPIEVVVNNAGYGQLGPVEEVTEDEIRRQFETNVFGVHRVIRATVPRLRHAGRGKVINVSSVAGRISSPFFGVYSASKFAVEALSDALRVELRPFGVNVVVIEPGPIKTEFVTTARETTERLLANREDSAYGVFFDTTERGTDVLETFALGADSVARTIFRAANSRSPRSRYTVTLPAKAGAIAARLLPDSVMDFAMARATGL